MKRLFSFLLRHIPRKFLQRFAGPALKTYGFFLRGNGVSCPVCGASYRHFLPYGRFRSRNNALCPNCLSLERHRLLWLYLQNKTPFFSQVQDVLHVAPEACFIRRFERIHGNRYMTVDLESPLARIKADIHTLPFAENSFHVVLCNHVLEHVQDDIGAMKELYRVMKPGAFAILQVPFFTPVPTTTFEDSSIVEPMARERAFGQSDHVRKYGADYVHRIAKSGLIAMADHYGMTINPETAKRLAIVPSEIIYIAFKKK
jgi:Methyltransferase domain